MGKQVKEPNPFAGFVPEANPVVKPTGFSDFVQAPLTKEEARGGLFREAAFQGDSQYDEGLVFGADQQRLRADNQPWTHQLANQTAKVVPGIALGLIENAGYLAELFDETGDYKNAWTEFAIKNRQDLDEVLTNYRQNPNEVFDLSDSAWWIQHGGGLVESIGEFFVTGAGIGSGLGKGAKALTSALKAGRYGEAIGQGVAQLGTASALAYTEGAMSGAQVYQDVLNETGNKALAAEAASKTVQLNTIINTGLNLTSVTPFFKTVDNLASTTKLGLSRKAGEKATDWLKRLDEIEAAGVPQASLRKALIMEAGQEALEEEVNLFAESEGRITGGIEKASSVDPFMRFLNKSFTEEGALSALLGAVGGVGQTAGAELIPYRNYTDENGNTTKINNRNLAALTDNEQAKQYISTLKADISYLAIKQKELNLAVETGNVEAVDKAREDLFNIAALKSLREGVAEEFTEDLKEIAETDNTQVGEDGQTEAMRKGYADSTSDHAYRERAIKKINDLKTLGNEYQNIRRVFPDKFVADEVFRQRMEVYSTQEMVDRLDVATAQLTSEIMKTAPNPELIGTIENAANVEALKQVINGLEEGKAPKRLINGLRNSLAIEEKLLNDTLEVDTEAKKQLTKNKGIIDQLVLSRAPLVTYREELNNLKADYAKTIANKADTEEKLLKQKEEISNIIRDNEIEKQKQQERQQEKDNLQEVKTQKATKFRENVGSGISIISSPEGGFDVIDDEAQAALSNHTTVEEARAAAKQLTTPKAKAQAIPIKEVISEPVVTETKPEPDYSNHGKTTKETKELNNNIEQSIDVIPENNTNKPQKIAYRAKEKDNDPINPAYLHLHSPTVNVGTEVTLKVATETEFYKKDAPKDKLPIGIYIKGQLSGYVALPKDNDTYLKDIRNKIISDGPINTTIANKDMGVLNKAQAKVEVSQAMPVIDQIVIGRDNKFFIGPDNQWTNPDLVNKTNTIENGITYAVITSPNGKKIGIPLDTKRLDKPVVDSIVLATRIFIHPENILPQDQQLLNEIFDKYDIDLRTPEGYEKYLKFFVYNYGGLRDAAKVAEFNQDKKDKFWINFTGNGVQFMRSGGAITVNGVLQAKEVGKNTPPENFDHFIEEFENHLSHMYYNVDLTQLQANRKVNLPLLKFDLQNESLAYDDYSKSNYIDHIKSTTETNVVGARIDNNEYTYFVQPKIFFNVGFMGQVAEQNNGKPLDKREEKAILAPKETTLPSIAKRLNKSKVDPDQVTDDIIDERQKYCK